MWDYFTYFLSNYNTHIKSHEHLLSTNNLHNAVAETLENKLESFYLSLKNFIRKQKRFKFLWNQPILER